MIALVLWNDVEAGLPGQESNLSGGIEVANRTEVGEPGDLELMRSKDHLADEVLEKDDKVVTHVCECRCPVCPVWLNRTSEGTEGHVARGHVAKRGTPGFNFEMFLERHPLALYMCIFAVLFVVFLTLTWFICRSVKKG